MRAKDEVIPTRVLKRKLEVLGLLLLSYLLEKDPFLDPSLIILTFGTAEVAVSTCQDVFSEATARYR